MGIANGRLIDTRIIIRGIIIRGSRFVRKKSFDFSYESRRELDISQVNLAEVGGTSRDDSAD